MITFSEKSHPIQNMGLFHRLVRFIVGVGILAYFIFVHSMQAPGLAFEWQVAAVALSLYPILTAMAGWDPLLALFDIRSCNDTGRNQCGTLPYQFRALFGRAPRYCDSDAERSLEACHDEPQERPVHQTWQVDRRPMIYPDEADWDAYFKRRTVPAKH